MRCDKHEGFTPISTKSKSSSYNSPKFDEESNTPFLGH